jgi:O-antigen ligase
MTKWKVRHPPRPRGGGLRASDRRSLETVGRRLGERGFVQKAFAPDAWQGVNDERSMKPSASLAADSPSPQSRAVELSLCVWAAGVQLAEGFAWVGVAGLALSLAVSPGPLVPRVRDGLGASWPLVAFVAWGFVATLLGGSIPSGTSAARQLDWLTLPLAAAGWWQLDVKGRSRVAATAAGVFLLACVAAAAQHAGAWPAPERFAPLRVLRIPFHRVYEPVPGTEGRFMAGGLLFHRLKFSNVGGLGVLWAFVIGLRSQGRRRALAWGLGLVGLVAIVGFTYARAASAALLFCLLVPIWVERPRRPRLIALGLAGVLAAGTVALAHRPFRERLLTSSSTEGSGGRRYLIEAGLAALRSRPLLGVGLGKLSIPKYVSPDAPVHVREHQGKAHNQLLSVAAEQGAVGLLLYVLLWGWLLRKMRLDTVEGIAGFASLTYLLLLGLLHDPLFHPEVSLALMLAAGLGLAASKPARGSASGTRV